MSRLWLVPPSVLASLLWFAACSSDSTSSPGAGFDAGLSGFDAGAKDTSVVDSTPDVSQPAVDASNASGCSDGTREGLSQATYPNIAACAGTWTGLIETAQSICSPGWHTCNGLEAATKALAYADAELVVGCFGIDAAQDNFACHSGCTQAVKDGVDTAENVDMAAIGSTCAYKFPGQGGCIAGGRVDFSENSGTGCSYAPGLTGVLCCADVTP